MLDTVTRYLSAITEERYRNALFRVLSPIADRLSSQALNSAGLVINGGGATFPKTGVTPFYASVKGDLVVIPAGTALPALTGINTAAGQFNVACYFVDGGGNLTVYGGTPAATLAGVNWPQFPQGTALVGVLIISGAGAFTGGTTALDAATTVYLSPVGAFDPTITI